MVTSGPRVSFWLQMDRFLFSAEVFRFKHPLGCKEDEWFVSENVGALNVFILEPVSSQRGALGSIGWLQSTVGLLQPGGGREAGCRRPWVGEGSGRIPQEVTCQDTLLPLFLWQEGERDQGSGNWAERSPCPCVRSGSVRMCPDLDRC